MKNLVSATVVALSLIAGGSAHAVELVNNGTFTNLTNGVGQIDAHTTAVGWTSNNYNFVFTNGNTTSPGGSVALWTASNGGSNTWNGLSAAGGNFLALDGDYNTGPVTQTITGLTSGKTYELTFDYAFGQQKGYNGATIQSLAASVGSSKWDSGNVDVANHGFTGWQSEEFTFAATSSSEVLSFLATGNLPVPPFALVSNVSITAVPELSTWAMMLAGFGGLGLAARLRRRRAVAA